MRILRYVAPSLITLFSLYCVIWGLVVPSLSTTYRVDAVFFGGLLLLLAFVHLRVTPPLQHKENELPKREG
ncbi:hypothetical protein ccbrp13_61620 [Ktedonobacteria bacterium brp13]|nr:hypothetical protein ccbrp13_61620 [Ktedonobacteria bacterium brp13]